MIDLYQHRDNYIKSPIVDANGQSRNASDFDNAIYVLYQRSDFTEVYRTDLTGNISVIDEAFEIFIPKASITVSGTNKEYYHTLVVGRTGTEELPQVYDVAVNIIPGINL